MTPTQKLRWLVRRNTVTAAEVSAYRDASGLPLMEARAALANEQPAVLQQWWMPAFDEPAGEWRDVPVDVEPSGPVSPPTRIYG